MKFLAVMLVLIFGRYKRRSQRAVELAQANQPVKDRYWWLLIFGLFVGEVLLLEWFSWSFGFLLLVAELLALYFYLENWSPSDITGKYYQDWCRGDFEASWLQLAGLLGLQRTDDVIDTPAAHYAICQQYLYLSLTGFFAVLFWFVCLGLPGLFLALWGGWTLQRLAAKRLDSVAQWVILIPARLLGFTFFIVGNGFSAYSQLKHPESKALKPREWLFQIALGAIGEDSTYQFQRANGGDEQFMHHAAEEIVSLNQLIRRAAILWLLVLGLLTMLGIESPFY
ncbi:hypothetical protein [Amphritea sp.]|uniref:hypothetical protein n=1 Tax=Amphritea sp. TaxID=1872502 RepID=UPI003A93DA15